MNDRGEARHFGPSGTRELRAQSVHRLQIGLFGLCAMLLIVGLANIIMERARETAGAEPVTEVIAADSNGKKPASDPLADIGVLPSADPSPGESQQPADGAGLEAEVRDLP
jgi:hypothetical protein